MIDPVCKFRWNEAPRAKRTDKGESVRSTPRTGSPNLRHSGFLSAVELAVKFRIPDLIHPKKFALIREIRVRAFVSRCCPVQPARAKDYSPPIYRWGLGPHAISVPSGTKENPFVNRKLVHSPATNRTSRMTREPCQPDDDFGCRRIRRLIQPEVIADFRRKFKGMVAVRRLI